jgi:hypothetical protein
MGFRIDSTQANRYAEPKPQVRPAFEINREDQAAIRGDHRIAELRGYANLIRNKLEEKQISGAVTPDKALDLINALPRPDASDTAAVKVYTQRCVEIARGALQKAQPPDRNDFKGPNPPTAYREYTDARTYFDAQIRQLKAIADTSSSTTLPPLTDKQIERAAQDIINRHGGYDHLNADAVGGELAQLAKSDPRAAALIGQKTLELIDGTTKEDNVSQAFVEKLSDADLRKMALDPDGKAFLESASAHLLMGSVHDREVRAAGKIQKALTGLDPQSLNGDPEHDAKVIDDQLKTLPPQMREAFVKAVVNHPFGLEALRYAATMSGESQKALGEGLGQLYQHDPAGTMKLLQTTDASRPIPYYYQSGIAKVIAQSGNDNLIRAFAQHEIDKAKQDKYEVRGYLNAVTAWSGLSPNALQDVMKHNRDFYEAVRQAGRLTEGPGNQSGFPNYNILEPGLGDLLTKASQIKGADGQATPQSLKLFATAIKYAGDNPFTQQGAGAFFIENARKVIDTYTDPANFGPDADPSVLQAFFARVIYAPGSNTLSYKGQPMVELIMGNGNGVSGLLGDVTQAYLNEARQPNDTESGRENDHNIGIKLGYLWGAVSGGLLDSVHAYKDQFEKDKEFRNFVFDSAKFALGAIAEKLGASKELINQAVDGVQNIYEAGKAGERKDRIEKFKAAFTTMNNSLLSLIAKFERNNKNVEGLQGGYYEAINNFLTVYLVKSWIDNAP